MNNPALYNPGVYLIFVAFGLFQALVGSPSGSKKDFEICGLIIPPKRFNGLFMATIFTLFASFSFILPMIFPEYPAIRSTLPNPVLMYFILIIICDVLIPCLRNDTEAISALRKKIGDNIADLSNKKIIIISALIAITVLPIAINIYSTIQYTTPQTLRKQIK